MASSSNDPRNRRTTVTRSFRRGRSIAELEAEMRMAPTFPPSPFLPPNAQVVGLSQGSGGGFYPQGNAGWSENPYEFGPQGGVWPRGSSEFSSFSTGLIPQGGVWPQGNTEFASTPTPAGFIHQGSVWPQGSVQPPGNFGLPWTATRFIPQPTAGVWSQERPSGFSPQATAGLCPQGSAGLSWSIPGLPPQVSGWTPSQLLAPTPVGESLDGLFGGTSSFQGSIQSTDTVTILKNPLPPIQGSDFHCGFNPFVIEGSTAVKVVEEDEAAFYLQFDFPGVDPRDTKVGLDPGNEELLTIQGAEFHKRGDDDKRGGDEVRRKYRVQAACPIKKINLDGMKCKINDGVVKLTLPKHALIPVTRN